ncbi:MAG: glycyl-radical enzyme activating protein [Eubacterium sp.]|nr:glycyl-radical enzyme activating protein [Eubacterium sp.]
MRHDEYVGRDMKGTVLRLEKSSIYDGDGFRTVVFLKGCPLRCQWCSTPESQKRDIESTLDGSITYGKIMTVEEVLVEVRKDSIFYFHSGGGMTLSGGEIMAQHEFVLTLLRRARYEAIDTCIETSFFTKWDIAKPIFETANTVFTDLKIFDEEKHIKYTGVSNKPILENIRNAGTLGADTKYIIRTPLIPGVNDAEEDLEKIGQFLSELPYVHHIQLLPYHRLGTDTYRKLGKEYLLKDVEVPPAEHMEWCRNVIKRYYDHVI